ncbi:MAG: protein translocase subunit SecD [Ardenticatenaceae bacterium]|nr:protein translocase subunit SecD [Ardenticatenaceae bacterium]MCB9446648.1 protein translocase subunit SecD [Ardenticatenaceae bacterium]
MDRRDFIWLGIIILILAAAGWIAQNPNYPIVQGLDLQGGLQVLLEADVPADQSVTTEQMDTARQIIDQRVNALGVAEPLVITEGERRILVELPGIENPDEAISLIQETALLEFVDTGDTPLAEGTCIRTSTNTGPSRCEFPSGVTDPEAITNPAPTYETVLTGAALREASTKTSQFGESYVAFALQPDESDFFAEYTRTHIGKFLTIVLDKQVISSPRINAEISDQGSITGNFTLEDAQKLALQLRFGSLPVPLRIESTRQVGATLGDLSIASSIRAGVIGLAVVLLFMLVYYRLPGFLADVALLGYALLNLAVFMLIPITLTLPAITGFLISTGMAVDANILVFERMKEELRRGSSLGEAINAGFDRAWTSIRDSNIATLVISLILLIFGRSFGASTVQGFAYTLAIGVMISMFTAVFVTRTFVRIVIGRSINWLSNKKWLLGV